MIDPVSRVLYTYVPIYLPVAAGIYFTIRTRFIQIRFASAGCCARCCTRGRTATASRRSRRSASVSPPAGTGNIAAGDRADGGWAGRDLLDVGGGGHRHGHRADRGHLGQIFKVRADDGSFRGGPALLHPARVGSAGRRHVLRGAAGVSTFGFAFNMLQANAINDVLNTSHEIEVHWTTVGLVLLSAPVLVRRGQAGGQGRRVRVAADGAGLRDAGADHRRHAYRPPAAGAGPNHRRRIPIHADGRWVHRRVAAAMLNGVKRGLFSNEAGMGSAPTSPPPRPSRIRSNRADPVARRVRRHHDHLLGNGFHHPDLRTGDLRPAAPGKAGRWADPGGDRQRAGFVDHRSDDGSGIRVRVLLGAGQLRYAEINLFFLGAKNAIMIFRLLVLGAIALGATSKLPRSGTSPISRWVSWPWSTWWPSCCWASGRSPRSATTTGRAPTAATRCSSPSGPACPGRWRATSGAGGSPKRGVTSP